MMRRILPVGVAVAATAALARAAPTERWATPADATAFAHSPISLIHAIAIAEDKAFPGHPPGLRALHARFDGAADQFRVTLVTRDTTERADVPARFGDQVTLQRARPLGALPRADRRLLHELAPEAIDLAAAIAIANDLGGRAVDAGLEQQAGGLKYRVDVVVDGTLRRAAVDPISGGLRAATARATTPGAAKS